jgi:hypothetical protein
MFSLAMQNHSMKDDTMQFVAVVVLPDEVPVSTHNVPACTVPTLVDTTAVQVVANAPVRTPEPATHLVWFSHNPHRHRAFCWCMGTKNHHQCYNYTLHHSPPNQHGTCRANGLYLQAEIQMATQIPRICLPLHITFSSIILYLNFTFINIIVPRFVLSLSLRSNNSKTSIILISSGRSSTKGITFVIFGFLCDPSRQTITSFVRDISETLTSFV